MTNKYVSKADDLVTNHASQRSGFLEYALRKSKESIPYIDKANALKIVLEQNTKTPKDILKLKEEKYGCYQAAGVSVKAKNYLSEDDLNYILLEFIKEFLEPAGKNYIDELIYRYLLTLGDALGGRMRNLVGSIANEKLTRNIISQIEISNLEFEFYLKSTKSWVSAIELVPEIRSIRWKLKNGNQRQLVYNLTVPIVKKNIDIVILNCHSNELSGSNFKEIIVNPKNYVSLGELKGGIDPAGADEHWKTANTALSRVRDNFKKHNIDIPLIFIGAAIENSMSKEIFNQYSNGKIANCANLTMENQLINLCNWLVKL
jgi:hypothetical protein